MSFSSQQVDTHVHVHPPHHGVCLHSHDQRAVSGVFLITPKRIVSKSIKNLTSDEIIGNRIMPKY